MRWAFFILDLPRPLLWGACAVFLLIGLSLATLWSFGRFARRARAAVALAIPPGTDAPLDALLSDSRNAAALISDPAEALGVRLASIARAARSIDIMTYIWSEDASGYRLARALMAQARRGVRVRLLVDDVSNFRRDPLWVTLNRTKGIEVRLFNPVRARARPLRRGLEILLSFLRYNRRMHGKLWIVDNRLAVVGGRNLGDIYFGLATGRKRNVADLDLLLTGPIVLETSAVFDAFWNSELALPIAALWRGKRPGAPGLPPRRVRLEAHARMAHATADAHLEAVLARRHAAGQLKLLADPPEKALGTRKLGSWLPDRLDPVLMGAQGSVTIVSPYFVPGRSGMAELLALVRRGVKLSLITISLAVIDHPFVHGAYRWYRQRLLQAGVEVFEYCFKGGAGPMLHAKAAVIDQAIGFVGSFNFDQRSAWLNTEIGVLFNDPGLIAALADWIEQARARETAFRVEREGIWTRWQRPGEPRVYWFAPHTSGLRRALTFLLGHLPIHRYL